MLNRVLALRRLRSIPVCLILLAAPALRGQGTGSVTGVVSDASQARLPGATVAVTNLDTGVSATVTTNEAGEYTIPLLQVGRYELTAGAPGFRTHAQSGLLVELGRVSRLDLALEVGEVTETVEVVGSAPLVESESSTVGQFIENKAVTDMPLNGRRAGELAALMGNAVTISKGVIRPRIAVAGSRGDQQQWLIDGVNSSNVALEIPQALFNPPVEAVQEMRVQQNGYSAEYGNSAGGVMTIVSRSGTNQLHGSLYEFIRNDKLDARNFFAARKAPLRRNVFGFAAGGPVVRNRSFFFVNNEWQKQRIGVTNTLTVPTLAKREGDFSGTTNNAGALTRIFDPFSGGADREPFANNVIPTSRLDPVGRNLSAFYPSPNRPASNAAGANNFVGNRTNALNLSTLTLKADHHFSERDRFTFRFILHDFPTNNTPVFTQPAADPFGISTDRRAFSFLFSEVHTFTPTLINDLRWNWQPRRFQFQLLEADGEWPQQLGLLGVNGSPFPRVGASGYIAMGRANQHRIQRPIRDTHIVDSLTWFHGGHTVKFGGEARLSRNQDDLRRWVSGNLDFRPQGTRLPGTGNTGDSVASMLLGYVHRGRIQEFDTLDRRAQYYAGFVQDDWKATQNFTLNLGLRWETHTPRTDALDRQNGFDLTAVNPVCNCPGTLTFASRDGLGRTVYDGDYNNFSPRVGFAWQPLGDGKTVIRSSYGLFYGPPLPGSNNTAAGFGVEGDFVTPDNGITAPFLLRDGFPAPSRAELGPGFGAVEPGARPVFSPQFIDRERQITYSQMWNLSLQRSLGATTVLELSYLGNVGHKLPARGSLSINQVRPENFGPGNRQQFRPFPQFNAVSAVTRMWGNSNYHGFNLKLERRFSQGLSFLTNYTWSKFIDDTPAQFEAGEADVAIQNLYNRAAERGLSGNDVRHRLVWSSVYEIPFGKDRAVLNSGPLAMVLGGWNFGTIITLQQGSPMALTTQVNGINGFTPGPQRVDVVGDPELPASQRTVERFFDTTAVAQPARFTFGNSGRDILTGPGIINFDMSLLKNHRWGERFNVQFRFEAFNFFNRAQFNEPGRALGAANFGVISSAGDPRSLQFGLKFAF